MKIPSKKNDDSIILNFTGILAKLFVLFIFAYIILALVKDKQIKNAGKSNIKTDFPVQQELLFESGRADIMPEGAEYLMKLADTLKQNEKFRKENTSILFIKGFTDNKPIKTKEFASNWELSTKRAVNILKIFTDSAHIPGNRLAVGGFSEYYPRASNETEEGRRKNRIINIVIIDRKALFNEDKNAE